MSRKISRSFINGRAGAGTAGQGLKVEWDSTEDGELHWKDVDESSLEYVVPWSLGGSNYGFCAGGNIEGGTTRNTIQKNSYSSDGNSTDVADLTITRSHCCGQSSSSHGYVTGGDPGYLDVIEKYSFTAGSDASDVGNLTAGRSLQPAGQSSSTYGYQSGGNTGSYSDIVDKFSFSSDGNAADVGNLTVARDRCCGQSSADYGYTSGGNGYDVIDKSSYSSDGNSTDVGNLASGNVATAAGHSSSDYGFCCKGNIDRFSFSSDGNSTDYGDLSVNRGWAAGTSSTTHGYTYGGDPGVKSNVIDKFAYSSGGTATDVGDVLEAIEGGAGAQY